MPSTTTSRLIGSSANRSLAICCRTTRPQRAANLVGHWVSRAGRHRDCRGRQGQAAWSTSSISSSKSRQGVPWHDARLCSLPRPQVRPHLATRLLRDGRILPRDVHGIQDRPWCVERRQRPRIARDGANKQSEVRKERTTPRRSTLKTRTPAGNNAGQTLARATAEDKRSCTTQNAPAADIRNAIEANGRVEKLNREIVHAEFFRPDRTWPMACGMLRIPRT